MNIKITGSGSYIPTEVVSNIDFAKHVFLNDDGTPFPHPNDVVAEKFLEITGIQERRYVTDDLLTSDIATIAAKKAIEDAKNKEKEIKNATSKSVQLTNEAAAAEITKIKENLALEIAKLKEIQAKSQQEIAQQLSDTKKNLADSLFQIKNKSIEEIKSTREFAANEKQKYADDIHQKNIRY